MQISSTDQNVSHRLDLELWEFKMKYDAKLEIKGSKTFTLNNSQIGGSGPPTNHLDGIKNQMTKMKYAFFRMKYAIFILNFDTYLKIHIGIRSKTRLERYFFLIRINERLL
jgi:hypothetical protein